MSTPRRPAPRSIGTPTMWRVFSPIMIASDVVRGPRNLLTGHGPLVDHHLHTEDRPAALEILARIDLDDLEARVAKARDRVDRTALDDDRAPVERVGVAGEQLRRLALAHLD